MRLLVYEELPHFPWLAMQYYLGYSTEKIFLSLHLIVELL